MKKLLMIGVLMITTVMLFSCTGPYEINFRDKDMVDMSNQDVATLLSTVAWENDEGTALISFDLEGSFLLSVNYGFSSSDIDMDVDITSETYITESEQISDVAIHSTSRANITAEIENSYVYASDESTSFEMEGTLGFYLYEGFLYTNPDIFLNEDGTETTVESKQKLNEEITQDMWDEFSSEFDINDLQTGGMGSIYSMPTELLDLLDSEHVADMLEAFPMVTVYERDGLTDVHFEISKPFILDHIEDLYEALYDILEESGEDLGTEEQKEENMQEAVDALTEQLNYFETLSASIDVVIEDNTIVRTEVEIVILTTEDALQNLNASIDMTLSFIASYGYEMPNFPNDLDDYTPTDNPLEGIYN